MGQRDVIPHLIPYGKTSAGMIVRSWFAGSRGRSGVSYAVKTEENIRSKSRRSGLCENLDVRRQKPGGVSFCGEIMHGHVLLQERQHGQRPWCRSQWVSIVESKERHTGVLGHHWAEGKQGVVSRIGCRMKGGDACYILGRLFASYHAAELNCFVMFWPKSRCTTSLWLRFFGFQLVPPQSYGISNPWSMSKHSYAGSTKLPESDMASSRDDNDSDMETEVSSRRSKSMSWSQKTMAQQAKQIKRAMVKQGQMTEEQVLHLTKEEVMALRDAKRLAQSNASCLTEARMEVHEIQKRSGRRDDGS